MNTKDVPAMYSTAFWYLFVVLLVFLALLRNRDRSRTSTDRSDQPSLRSMKGVTVVTQ